MTKPTILLVEDNASDEELTLMAARMSAVASDMFVVRDGAEAVDYLFATGSHVGRDARSLPALVLLDLNLPRLSGFDVLRRLRADERTRLLPVVVLSSSVEEGDIREAYAVGANAYVRKQMSFSAFAKAMAALMAFWLLTNERLRPSFRARTAPPPAGT